jgi:hypothetical protein
MTYIHTFNTPRTNSSLVTVAKLKAKYRFRAAAILFYIKYALTKKFFEDCSYISIHLFFLEQKCINNFVQF